MRAYLSRPLAIVLILCTPVLASACQRIIVPRIERIELHRSAPQHLVLSNGGDQPAFIEPLDEGGAALRVDPGSQLVFDFLVASAAEVEPVPGLPWRAVTPGTATNLALLIEPAGYLQHSGPDLAIRVRLDEQAPQERRFSLQCGLEGWEAGPAPEAAHQVDLAQPPLAGVPERVCPATF